MTFTVPVWLLVTLGIAEIALIALAIGAIYLLIQLTGAIVQPRW